MSKEFYTVKEVAEILGLSPDRIYENLRTGRLHGTQFTERGAWRIPAAEIQRLKGTSLEEFGAQPEDKSTSWSEYLELAIQLQNSLSSVGPKDWAIWGLPDTGKPPDTSEAGLRLWMDRGELVVKLSTEMDQLSPLFMSRLKASFNEFGSYDRWRESLTNLIRMCFDLASEIRSKAKDETNLLLDTPPGAVFSFNVSTWGTGETGGLSGTHPAIREGYLINVSKYIYEFALDNYASVQQPVLEILEDESKHCWVVPGDLLRYGLAMGSRDEMEKCRKATVSLAARYVKDERLGEIVAMAQQVKKQAAPFRSALSAVIEKATGGS